MIGGITMAEFWKATAIRCARTFLTTIAGCWTAGALITDLDWKGILVGAFSATVYIFILCLIAGLPEVDREEELEDEDEDDDEWSGNEDDMNVDPYEGEEVEDELEKE